MIGLEHFVVNNTFWVYLIIFGGMFIEGEIFFLSGIFFVAQRYLNWFWFLSATFSGVLIGDIAWYFLGRNLDKISIFRFLLKIKFSIYHEWLERNFVKRYSRMAFFSKFLYYFNRLTPLIAGWQKLNFKKFFKIHFLAAVLWVSLMSIIGYFLSLIIGLEGLRSFLKRFELIVITLAIFFIGGEYLAKKIFSRQIKKQLKKEEKLKDKQLT